MFQEELNGSKKNLPPQPDFDEYTYYPAGQVNLGVDDYEENKQKRQSHHNPAFALFTNRDQLTCRVKPSISYLLCGGGINLLNESHHFSG